jgi:hypothetical protein
MSIVATRSHMESAEHFLTQAEEVHGAHRFSGDRDAASIPLAMIAQAHATLALIQALNNIQAERRS